MLYVKVEAIAGANIEETCIEAVALAKRLGIAIEFNFNGVTCFADIDGDAWVLAQNWREAMESEKSLKFARS